MPFRGSWDAPEQAPMRSNNLGQRCQQERVASWRGARKGAIAPSCSGALQAALVGREQNHPSMSTSLGYGRARSVARRSLSSAAPTRGKAPPRYGRWSLLPPGPALRRRSARSMRARKAAPGRAGRSAWCGVRSPPWPRSMRLPGSPVSAQGPPQRRSRSPCADPSMTAGGRPASASRKPSQ